MAGAVQYRGLRAILEGFDDAGIPAWALVYNKQIVGKCAGKSLQEARDDLEQLLKTLSKSNTTAQYTLCFYEEIKDRKKIKLAIEPDLAKNVVLFDSEDNPSPAFAASGGVLRQVMDRLDVIDAKLALKEPEEEGEEEEKVSGTGGFAAMINKILDNPKVQERIGEKFFQWFDMLMTPSAPPQNSIPMQQQAAAMGSTGQTEMPQITQEQALKIQAAIEVLARIDPNLGDNLEKIAQVAQDTPKKYFNALNMLKTFL